MKRLLIYAVGVLLAFGCKQALQTAELEPPLPEVAPETVQLSSDSLATIDKIVQKYMEAAVIPGATMAIVKDGQTAYYKAWGSRDIDDKETMQRDDIFRMASMTKAITSVAILMLQDEGKLNVEDPLSKFIPEFGKVEYVIH